MGCLGLVRRRLSWLVGAWLLCQIANVAAAPLTFCCQNVASAEDEEECCPGLLPGQVCPMHHVKEGEPTCKMRGVCSGTDASIVALAGSPPATAERAQASSCRLKSSDNLPSLTLPAARSSANSVKA